MLLFLAILFPPLAVAMTGRVRDLPLNVLLTLLFWLPGSVHAVIVVAKYYDDKDPLLLTRAIRAHAHV
jgi:uncharacterized membrane protein YqaE (UPF0057 family)